MPGYNEGIYNSQFGYCSLVWMMHCQSVNSTTNRVHERALSIVYNDKFSSFENPLEKDKAVKSPVRNLQVLVAEIIKLKNSIAPKIISGIFKLSSPTYNLRNKRDFVSNHMKTLYFGTDSLSNLGPKLWDLLPQDLKTLTSLTLFKSQVKKMGSTKLSLTNLQSTHPECWLYIIQSYFICNLLTYLFSQIICNYCFIYLFIYILYS